MSVLSRISIISATILAGAAGIAAPAYAQTSTYPTRPVTMVVPFAPGSTVDLSARVFSRDLEKRLGQPFPVENRPGIIAFRIVKNAAPDGQMVLWHSSSATVAQTTLKAPDFDIRKDFAPVAMAARGPLGLFVQTNSPYKSVRALLEDARRNPGKLNYASAGIGSTLQFVMEVFKGTAKVDIVHVPYRGGAPAVQALVAGDVNMLFFDASLANQSTEKVRMLALASKERSPYFPDVPTFAEDGGPEFEAAFWLGMFAPGGTPRAIVEKLNGAIKEAVQAADVQDYMKKQRYIAAWMTPDDLQKVVAKEVELWMRVVRDVGVPLQ